MPHPAEDAAPYVAVGDTVKKGQTVAIVEAMKLMNDDRERILTASVELKSLWTTSEVVEYGQPLFSNCLGCIESAWSCCR